MKALLFCLVALSSASKPVEIVEFSTSVGLIPVLIRVERSSTGATATSMVDERNMTEDMLECLQGLQRSKTTKLSRLEAQDLFHVARETAHRHRPIRPGFHSTGLRDHLYFRDSAGERIVTLDHDPQDFLAHVWITTILDTAFFIKVGDTMVARTIEQVQRQRTRSP